MCPWRSAEMVRHGLTILAGLLIASGALWALQGAGLVMWPVDSVMLREQSWVIYGLVTAAIGAILLVVVRRGS